VVGKKKKKKRKKLEARVAKWLAFWQTATRLPVILKRTIQHRPVLSKLDKLWIISLLAHI
jgi:hypothetical protein